ncbi:MAG: GNAT family N-acetyltransferase [Deltaproteobacteria bacterium]|nr:GNAT family N-acetyltransferase [Deltaproteobacteria bacterium]
MAENVKPKSPDTDLEIRPYRPGDENDAVELFRIVFEKEKPLDHWNWEYRSRPMDTFIMLGYYKNALAAQCAGVPLPARCGDRVIRLLQGVDFMSHPGFRSHRVFMKTAAAFFGTFGGTGEHQAPLIYGFPGTRHRILGEKKLQYTTLSAVHCLRKTLGPGDAKAGWTDRARGRVEVVSGFDERADALWNRNQKAYPMAVIRNREFLNWRFSTHPTIHYHVLQVVDRLTGRVGAWAVLRQAPDRGQIVDFFPSLDAPWMNRLLLRAAERNLLERSFGEAETWCHPNSPANRVLLREGWHIVPQPDELHIGAISFSDEIQMDWVREHFYYTLGDADIA